MPRARLPYHPGASSGREGTDSHRRAHRGIDGRCRWCPGGLGASTASTEAKPASARNPRAVCSPQAVPSPAPPSAKETVMQGKTLMP